MKIKDNETIIYKGNSNISKVAKNYPKLIVSIFLLIIFWSLLIWAYRFDNMRNSSFSFIIIVLMLFTMFVVKSFYDTFWGHQKYKDDSYIITNKNIYFKHNKDEMILSIYDVAYLGLCPEKDGYGSVFLFYNKRKRGVLNTSNISLIGIKNYTNVADKIVDINKDITVIDLKKKTRKGK